MFEMEIRHENSRHCLEDILDTVAYWWGRESILMFEHSMGFIYEQQESGLLGKAINSGWTDTDLGAFEHYHGIYLEKTESSRQGQIWAVIECEINKNNPVALYIDSYYCPWTPTYKKYHNLHCCIVIGAENGVKLYCIDPYVSRKVETILWNDFVEGSKGYMKFRLGDCLDDLINPEQIIQGGLDHMMGRLRITNTFDAIRSFAGVVEKKLDITLETEGYSMDDMRHVHLFIRLIHVSNGRYNYAKLLKYLAERFDKVQFLTVFENLLHVGDDWRKVVGLLSKAAFRPSLMKKVRYIVLEKLLEIADQEERLANELQGIIMR